MFGDLLGFVIALLRLVNSLGDTSLWEPSPFIRLRIQFDSN